MTLNKTIVTMIKINTTDTSRLKCPIYFFMCILLTILFAMERKKMVALDHPESYLIHDNGGRPFKVEVLSPTEVQVFQLDIEGGHDEDDHYTSMIHHFTDLRRVMIGESPLIPMTEFSGAHGPEFKGNTILLEKSDGSYVLISDSIIHFTTLSKIVQFVSPVGNNNVPYPYALDKSDKFYIFTENAILEQVPESQREDPVEYFYNNEQSLRTHRDSGYSYLDHVVLTRRL
jgi:hypothetical protein